MSTKVFYRNKSPLLAGIDNFSLDTRVFNPSQNDLERVCRFFKLGNLQEFKKEKDIQISHSNFFIYIKTTRGEYALKFYPPNAAKTITVEYVINRFLNKHHFLTPIMHTGDKSSPFFAIHHRLATCFTYIHAHQAWQHIKKKETIHHINSAMFSLKNILPTMKGRINLSKQESLINTIRALNKDLERIEPYTQKKIIQELMREICCQYQDHQTLFKRLLIHNNASLTNFLINKNTVYTLDLSHIKEDYILSDLASLIISCLFINIPQLTIDMIIKDYFSKHSISPPYAKVLHTLIKLRLLTEYFKNLQREKLIALTKPPDGLAKTYVIYLKDRQQLIMNFLNSDSFCKLL